MQEDHPENTKPNSDEKPNNQGLETKGSHPWRRRLFFGGLSLAFFLIIFNLLIYFYLNPFIKRELIRSVALNSDSLYQLDIGELRVSFLNSTIQLKDFHLQKNSRIAAKSILPNQIDIDLKVGNMRANGIRWMAYLRSGNLSIGRIFLKSPTIQMGNSPLAKNSADSPSTSRQIKSFLNGITPNLKVKQLFIENAAISFDLHSPVGKIYHKADNIRLDWQNIEVDTDSKKPVLESIFWDEFDMRLQNYTFKTPDQFYEIKTQKVVISTRDSLMNLTKLRIFPTLAVRNSTLAQSFSILGAKVDIRGVDFPRLIFQGEMDIQSLAIEDNHLELERFSNFSEVESDQDSPRNAFSRLKESLRELPYFIKVGDLNLKNFSFYFRKKRHPRSSEVLLYHRADTINLRFKGLALGKALNILKVKQPLYSESVNFSMRNYEFTTPDAFYKVKVDRSKVSSKDSLVYLDGLKIRPLISPAQFSARTAYQALQVEADIQQIRANTLDVERLAYQQEFELGGIHLIKPRFKAYLDKTKPKKPGQKYQNFEQVLQSIPIFIRVDTFKVENANLNYQEKSFHRSFTSVDLASASDSIKSQPYAWANHQANNINLKVQDIELGQAFKSSALEKIDTKSLEFTIAQYRYESPQYQYHFFMRGFLASSNRSLIQIDSLQLNPRLNRQAFDQTFFYRLPQLNISVGQIQSNSIDFKRLLLYQEIDWGYLQITRPKVDIYVNAQKPPRPKPLEQIEFKELKELPEAAPWEAQASQILHKHLAYFKNIRLNPQDLSPENQRKWRSFQESVAQEESANNALRVLLRSIPVYIKLDTLQVSEGELRYRRQEYHPYGSGLLDHEAQKIDFLVPQIRLGKASEDSTFQHFYSGNILLNVQNYRYLEPGDDYSFQLEGIQSSLEDSLLLVKKVRLLPRINREDFTKKHEYRKTYSEVNLESISARAIDLDRLVFDQELVLNSLYLQSPELTFFSDLRKRKNPDIQDRTFEDWLAAVPIYIRIDTLGLRQAKLEYHLQSESLDSLGRGQATHKIDRMDFMAREIELASAKTRLPLHPENRLLYSNDIRFYLEDYAFEDARKLYRLEIKKLESFSQDSSLLLKDISYHPQLERSAFEALAEHPRTQIDINIDQVRARIADPRPFFDYSSFPFHHLEVEGVNLELYQSPKDSLGLQSGPQVRDILARLPEGLRIDTLMVKQVEFLLEQSRLSTKVGPYLAQHEAHNAYLNAYDFSLDSLTKTESERFFFAKKLDLGLEDYSTLSPDKLYSTQVKEIRAFSEDSLILMKNFKFEPTVNDEAFMRLKLFQTDRFEVNSQELSLHNFHFKEFLRNESIRVEKIEFDSPNIDVYRDKRISRSPDFEPVMPNKIFQSIPITLAIDTIKVVDGRVKYGERVFKGTKTGEVFFSNINGSIFNIDNRSGHNDTLRLVANSRLMGAGLLTARLKMPLMSPQLYCTYDGGLGEMKADFFNRIIETNENIKIKKGQIQQVIYQVSLKDSLAQGLLKAGYRRLKIEVLKEEDPNKKKGFITFIANLILKSRNNLQRRRYKVGEINYTRKGEVGFIGLLWRSLASGLVDTLK